MDGREIFRRESSRRWLRGKRCVETGGDEVKRDQLGLRLGLDLRARGGAREEGKEEV